MSVCMYVYFVGYVCVILFFFLYFIIIYFISLFLFYLIVLLIIIIIINTFTVFFPMTRSYVLGQLSFCENPF